MPRSRPSTTPGSSAATSTGWPPGRRAGANPQGFAPVGTPMLPGRFASQRQLVPRDGRDLWPAGRGLQRHRFDRGRGDNPRAGFRTVYEGQARKVRPVCQRHGPIGAIGWKGAHSWFAPYWSLAAATQQALFFQRYMHESGATDEQVAPNRAQRPPQRPVEPEGDLPRPADNGGLPGGALDLDAAPPV